MKNLETLATVKTLITTAWQTLRAAVFVAMLWIVLAVAMCAGCTTNEPTPELEAPCFKRTNTDTCPAPENTITKWRAAWFLAQAYCQSETNTDACENATAYGWCPDGSIGSCATPVEDLELLDRCLGTVQPLTINPECAALFKE